MSLERVVCLAQFVRSNRVFPILSQQDMRRSASVEELLLRFISHADASSERDGRLLINAMSCFSTIFQGCLAPLEKVPTGLENLGVVLRDLATDVEKQDSSAVDCTRYSST